MFRRTPPINSRCLRGGFRLAAVAMCGGFLLAGLGCDRDDAPTPPTPPTLATHDTPTTDTAAPTAEALPEVKQYERLHDLMEDAERHYRYLRRNMDDGDQQELLQRALEMQALFAEAGQMTPAEQLEDADSEANRATLQEAYTAHMADLMPELAKLSDALRKDDRDAAKAALHELHEFEEAGHDAMGVKEH